jgi:nucleolar protein 14
MDNDDDRRDRKTVIDELIAESKKRKIERAREHEEILDMTDKLDSEWRELIPVVNKYQKIEPEKSEQDDYDRLVKEMIFAPRGEPTEKLKNEEDVARIEKERLEKLERDRLERMRGEDEGNETEKQPKHRSADDLDDGYFMEDLDGAENNDDKVLSYAINGDEEADESEEEDEEEPEASFNSNNSRDDDGVEEEEDESNEEEESGSEEEESDDDSLEDLKADEESEEEEEIDHKVIKISTPTDEIKQTVKNQEEKVIEPKVSKKDTEALDKIPFTIAMPESYEDLIQMFDGQSAKVQSVIIDRIIKTNHPKLHHANKSRMLKLFAFTLQYINDQFSNIDEDSISKKFIIVQEFVPSMFDMIQMSPEESSKCFLEVIKEKYEDYKKNPKRFPSLDTIIFFKIIGSLFPTSDLRHPIVTPSCVFLHHILSQAKIRSRSDVSCGLFLVTLVLDYQQLSKKFLPAVMNFLSGVCYLGVKKSLVQQIKTIPPFKRNDSLLTLDEAFKGNFETSMKLTPTDFFDTPIDDDFKIRSLNLAVNLINDFVKLYDEHVGLKYFLDPFESALNCLAEEKFLPNAFKNNVKRILVEFEKIRLDKKFVFPEPEKKIQPMIRLLEPRFETVLTDRRSMYSQAKGAKAEQQKLKHQVKREFKSAKRELRRDNEFLSKVRQKRKYDLDRERQAKVKRIFNEASVQQSEFNALSRTKGRKGKF